MGVLGPDGDGAIDGKTATPECVENLDALVAQKAFVFEPMACQQRRRVRFATAAGLVNELVEAQQENQLSRVLRKYGRYELVAIDELGYLPFANVGAELLFQVVSERSERAAIIVTTNLPFSEWTQVFKNARLCKALLDRVTDGAHIIETGKESYRFRRSLKRHKKTIKS